MKPWHSLVHQLGPKQYDLAKQLLAASLGLVVYCAFFALVVFNAAAFAEPNVRLTLGVVTGLLALIAQILKYVRLGRTDLAPDAKIAWERIEVASSMLAILLAVPQLMRFVQ